MAYKLGGISGRNMYRGQQKSNWPGELLLHARHLEGLKCQAEEIGRLYKGNKELVILGLP